MRLLYLRNDHRATGYSALWLITAMLLGALATSGHPALAQTATQARATEVFAKVGAHFITVQELAMALRSEGRRRFYHAKPPEEVLVGFRREVGELLIERALAVQEAKRRGIKVDKKAIDGEMSRQRTRMGQTGAEHDNKKFWDALRKEMEDEQLVGKLRAQINGRIAPNKRVVKTYYEQHPEKFTQPEQFHVSVILLRVQPSAGQSAWDAATREAERIRGRINNGADFAELARVHSADRSAGQGGDMGFVHKGMLSPNVEEAIVKLPDGAMTEPITVLEGVALFKIHARKAAHLGSLQEVEARATQLWTKEQEALAWKTLIATLRSGTIIKVEEKYLQSPS